jgi:uncharacterized protein (DUF2147 family)
MRNHKLVKFLIALSLLFVSFHALSQPVQGVVGAWLTIDDETNTPRSILKLFIDKKGYLNGQIVKIYFRNGEKETDVCTKCTQPVFKDKPIMGMVVMWGLKQVDYRKWTDGFILDPKNGQIYRCNLTLSPNGQELNVRGYIGFSLLGRTQHWMRVEQ